MFVHVVYMGHCWHVVYVFCGLVVSLACFWGLCSSFHGNTCFESGVAVITIAHGHHLFSCFWCICCVNLLCVAWVIMFNGSCPMFLQAKGNKQTQQTQNV